jgi:peptidoglycan/LPS O-acetylase OafA/YrhL
VYEELTRHPGNLHQLRVFFLAPHRAEHPWRVVVDTVAGQLAILPLSVARALGRATIAAGATTGMVLAAAQLGALVAALGVALRRRDQVAALLAAAALGAIVVAAFSVRMIRGELFGYLVAWISVLGLLACAASATILLRPPGPPRRASLVVLAIGIPLLLGASGTRRSRPRPRPSRGSCATLASTTRGWRSPPTTSGPRRRPSSSPSTSTG